MLLDAANHLRADERVPGRVLEVEDDAAFVLLYRDVEVLVAVQHLADVVLLRAREQHGERALAPELVKPALPRITQAMGLEARQDLQRAFRRDTHVHGSRSVTQGLISIGVDSRVINQISIMSELDTAMQPSVQSDVR